MMVTALTLNLQMCPGNEASSLTASMTAFLPPAQLALLPSQDFLRGAIEPRIRDSVALRVGQEGLESHINADVSMRTVSRSMLIGGLSCADDQRVPVPIGTMHQIDRFRLPLDGAVQLDLERLADLSRDMQMFVIGIQPHIAAGAVLSELERMPAVRLLETRETHIRNTHLSGLEKPFKRFREAISQHLNRGGRYILTATAFELCRQIILRGERTIGLRLLFHRLKHLIVDMPGLDQTVHEQMMLGFIRIQTIFKCFHHPNYSALGMIHQQLIPPVGGWQFIPIAEARGPLAALG